MFEIKKTAVNKEQLITLQNADHSVYAEVSLDEGARIKTLAFAGVPVIEEQEGIAYKDSYASSLLFPFANRIASGSYNFKGVHYQLECNENGGENALHGLVYDKSFELLSQKTSESCAFVTLGYKASKLSAGFPFSYDFSVCYTLTATSLSVEVFISNTDTREFPFTLGWHPYFYTSDLEQSFLNFVSSHKIKFDANLITDSLIPCEEVMPFVVADKQLDDSFVLKTDRVAFTTPEYTLELKTNTQENYLQLYTPENRNEMAIEPMTGISDSFNNGQGLQILNSGERYAAKWTLDFTKNNTYNE
jgi:aldose 1-epimerase